MTFDLDFSHAVYLDTVHVGSSSKVKVIGQSSRRQEENVAKVLGATSSEGFLVFLSCRLGLGAHGDRRPNSL